MAGIPMYYGIPTSGEVEAKMARDKMDVLKTQEKAIEVDELVKAKEIIKKQATEKLAEAKASRISPTAIPQAVDGYNQPAPASQVASPKMEAPTEKAPMPSYETTMSPNGEVTPMPSFMKGSATEARAKEPMMDETQPVEAQPTQEKTAVEGYRQPQQEAVPQQQVQQEVPQSPVSRVQKANLEYKDAYDQVEAAYKTADLFKQNGLLLQYQKQLKVAEELETTKTMAQERRIKSTKELMDLTGGIANSYVELARTTDDPTVLNRGWNSALMMMEMKGIPVDGLGQITDPRQRLQVAQQYATASIEASAKLKLEAELLKEKGRNDRAQASLELRQDLGEKRLRQSARAQEALQIRFDESKDLRERNFAMGRATKIISQAKEDRKQLNSEIDDLNFRVTELRGGRIYMDRAGNKLTKETRMQEIQDIQRDINKMTSQRNDLTDEIQGYETKFKDIGVTAKTKEEPAKTNNEPGSTANTDSSNSKVPTAERISKVQELAKAYPDQISTLKANWEETYPGFKFEDAIQGKVDTSSNKTNNELKIKQLKANIESIQKALNPGIETESDIERRNQLRIKAQQNRDAVKETLTGKKKRQALEESLLKAQKDLAELTK
jgi:hypothetical protein